MKNHWTSKISFSLLAAALCLCAFISIALSISDNQIHRFDDVLINWIQGMESPGMTRWMQFFTWIGSGRQVVIITILVMLVLYLYLGHRRELLFLTSVLVGSTVLNALLKVVFGRARPPFTALSKSADTAFPADILWPHSAYTADWLF